MLFTSYSGALYRYSARDNSIEPTSQRENDVNEPFYGVIFPVDLELIQTTTQTCVRAMVLSLTESCNMRCSYCVYSGNFPAIRKRSTRTMEESVAQKAIEWLARRSSDAEGVSLYFFGGEPLLQFDKIQRLVAFAEKIFDRDKITFGVSTNGTLINEKVIDWLSERSNVSLCVTLNGTERVHNTFRKYETGSETWADIIGKLALLCRRLGDEYFQRRVHFIANYANPYELLEICQWYERNGIRNVRFSPISFPHRENLSGERTPFSVVEERLAFRLTLKELTRLAKEKGKLPLYATTNSSLTKSIHFRERKSVDAPIHPGFCIPFSSRVFVDVDGNLRFCEKTDDVGIYGHVADGELNLKKLGEDIEQVRHFIKNVTKCRFCPAVRFCQMCYTCFWPYAADSNLFDSIRLNCRRMRECLRRELAFYTSLTETVPELMNTLEESEESDPYIQGQRIKAIKRIIENNAF